MNAEKQRNILLVEDEAITAMSEKMALEKYGYKVMIAHTGEEAVATVEKTPAIDLILMDINLGKGMDGTEAVAIILRQRDIPVVFLSSHMEPEVVEKTEKITSYGYVVKDSSITVLDASIKMAFKLFQAKKQEMEKEAQMATALEALKVAEETYRNIFLNAQTGLFRTEIKTGLLLDANDCVARFLGYEDREKLLEKPFNIAERYVDIKDRERMISLLKEYGYFDNFEARFRRNDGTIIWIRFAAKMVLEKGWIEGVSQDITKEKALEESLRENEERYRSILNTSPDGISIADMEGRIVLASPALVNMIGFEREDEMLGRFFSDFVSPDDRERVAAKVALMFQGTMMGLSEYHGLRTDGSVIDLEVNGEFIRDTAGRPTQMVFIIRDISKRKQTEAELSKSEIKFRAIFNCASDGMFIVDLKTRKFLMCNTMCVKMLGYTKEEFSNLDITDIHPQEDLPFIIDQIGKFSRGEEGIRSDIKFRRKNGSIFESDLGPAILTISEEKYLLIIFKNITERKQTEEALRQSEAMQANALQMTKAGHWEYDVDRDLFTFNDNFYRIFRTTAAAVGGYQMSSTDYARRFCHPDDMAQVGSETRAAIETSDPNYSRQIEHRILYADGEIGHLAVRFFILKDAQGRTVKTYGVNQDISERKRAEEEIERQLLEKEILLKEVHHRIKNNIASISGLISLHMQTVTNPEAVAVLKDAIGRVDSMRILYNKLLISEDYKDVSVKKYLDDLIDSIFAIFPNKAKIVLEKRIEDFLLNTKQLFPVGVIINEILTNTMKHAFNKKPSGLIEVALMKDKNHVTLTMQNNGKKLPAGFDIKESKGFGLMLVKMLSQQLGGNFSMEKGKGTMCKVEFDI